MITIDAFRSSASAAQPPQGLAPALEALWWLLKEDWDRAHKCVQGHEGEQDCDRVHAHLHRQEGDLAIAGYWYRRAERPVATCSLQEEWEQVATELLARNEISAG
jgi:hypothetical protein